MMNEDDVWTRLNHVPDPEIPQVNIVELGMVSNVRVTQRAIQITLRPPFASCPLLEWFRRRITEALFPAPVWIQYRLTDWWAAESFSEVTRQKLQASGIYAPRYSKGMTIHCPFCQSALVDCTHPVGHAPCRALYYCHACQRPFEVWKLS
jgi:ring-1,2-phenylacetyl-CoA epoxidase subunit PaaD